MRIYLDHAATTPVKPEVRDAMLPYLTDARLMANPSSAHADGKFAKKALMQLRNKVAEYFNCQAEEVLFNSGGSEGDTHALVGMALLSDKPVHTAISAIEHEAVVETAGLLRSLGHRVSVIPVDGDGVVELDALDALLKSDRPDVVSVMAVNNETGVVQPVGDIAEKCREAGVTYHCDAVRAAGHGLDHLLTDLNITILNCTAHKFGGPRGVGVLVSRGIRLPQLIRGGGQECGSRAGTENLAANAALVKALELATENEAARVEDLRSYLENELVDRFPDCEIHGKRAKRATHITSVSFKPLSGYKLQAALDSRGISVGTGSACHDDGAVSVSPVLSAMGVEEYLARGTIRISLGWNNTEKEVDRFLDILEEIHQDDDDLLCPVD